MPHQLSAVIITYNEARNIGRCLQSLVGVADEIVVLDSFSTDETEAICRRFGAHFYQHAFDGHIEQKNRALTYAQHNHVLALDADEALNEPLREAILREKAASFPKTGYSMNRLTNYCGQWVRHSGWYPDRKLRLFDRRQARWGGVNPHDKIEMAPGSSQLHLPGDLLHYSYYTVAEHLSRARKYADIAAKAMHRSGKGAAWWRVVVSPAAKFIRNYFLKAGFLDGRTGFTICRISALETYWKYQNLRNMRAFLLLALSLAGLLGANACSGSKPRSAGTPPRANTQVTPPPAPAKPADIPIAPEATTIAWLDSERLMPVLEQAQRENKVVMLEFYASWCAPCKVMEEEIFTQTEVYRFQNMNFLNMRTNYDSDAGRTIAQIYEVEKLPTILWLSPKGVVLERYTGMAGATELRQLGLSALKK